MDSHGSTHALVTGSAQGLGLAIAEELAARGCVRLALADRDLDRVAGEARRLSRNGVDATPLHVEMGDTASVAAMVDGAARAMGRIDAFANAAANTDRGSILDTTPEQWDAILDPNLKGAFFALQGVSRHAIDAGHPLSAVMILSITVHGGLPPLAPYVASKAGLAGVVKNAAHALRGHRIRVNGINVGWMATPGEDATQRKWHGKGDDWLERAKANSPFGALVAPEEVARQTAFFLGSESGVVTGSVMDFDQVVVGAYPSTD